MSFILDALRKADARRGDADTPELPGLPAAAHVASSSPVLPRLAIAAGLLAAGVVAASMWMARDPSSPDVVAVMPLQAPTTAAAKPRPPVSSPAATLPGTPDPDVRPLDREAAAGSVAAAGESAASSAAPAGKRTGADAAPAVTPGRVVYSDEPLDAPVTAPRPASKANRAPPTAPRGGDADFVMYSEFAVNSRSGVPPLRLDIHVYSDDPANRFVFVNMRKYREGDRVDGDILIDRITPDGAILSLRGQRFLLPRS